MKLSKVTIVIEMVDFASIWEINVKIIMNLFSRLTISIMLVKKCSKIENS